MQYLLTKEMLVELKKYKQDGIDFGLYLVKKRMEEILNNKISITSALLSEDKYVRKAGEIMMTVRKKEDENI